MIFLRYKIRLAVFRCPLLFTNEVIPRSNKKDLVYSRLSEERNPVRKRSTKNFSIQYFWGPTRSKGPSRGGDWWDVIYATGYKANSRM